MRITFNPSSLADYQTFLKVKRLPFYRFEGRTAIIPDEYAAMMEQEAPPPSHDEYEPSTFLFDYQAGIAAMAIRKRKFAIFADCGLGKTLVYFEFARHVLRKIHPKRVLIVSPLMVIRQTIAEAERFYGDTLPIEQVRAPELQEWLNNPAGGIGITNYDALSQPVEAGELGCLILDESSMLKSHYGKWGRQCLKLGRGLDWKLAGTGTPAPNDRIEYANHAVFVGASPSVHAFLARYFVNRGQTSGRWELKTHALRPFYRSLSHWSIFLTNPKVYGWMDNTKPLPPVIQHIHHVDLTPEQQTLAYGQTGRLFADQIGGITCRSVLSQIAKGSYCGRSIATNKPGFIRNLLAMWPDESTIIWCLYNNEQRLLERELPGASSITGATPYERREAIIEDFKSGLCKVLITKPKILGFGLNLHMATRQIFSGIQDSYESFYQAVKRSNRYGATRPLNVHIPLTDIEAPMFDTVLRKSRRIDQDTIEQEKLFHEQFTRQG